MKTLIALFALVAIATAVGQDEIRWGETFADSYQSEADGAKVSFQVKTPPKIDGQEKYPLLLVLNGGPRVAPR
ncbi:MAG: hypothetical protein AAF585_20000, partial [Verrucomicrobiota bacterium]